MAKVQEFYVGSYNGDSLFARACRDYAERREDNAHGRWDARFCERYGMGYAPSSGHALSDWAVKQGLNMKTLEEVGMVKETQEGSGIYRDVFQNRLMIPQRDSWCKVVAYMGRTLSDGEGPKYMNNAYHEGANLIYHKGAYLFGLDFARKAAMDYGCMNIVEGASDAITLYSLDVCNVVAPNGSHVTDDQLTQLKRFTSEICIIPDSDKNKEVYLGVNIRRGEKFAIENAEKALRMGFNVFIKEIPGKDGEKRDVGSYVDSIDTWYSLERSNFIIWIAQKLLSGKISSQDTVLVKKVCYFLALVSDDVQRSLLCDELKRCYGQATIWNKALSEAESSRLTEVQRQEEKRYDSGLAKYGLIQEKHHYCLLSTKKQITNFDIDSLYHIADGVNSSRILKITNDDGMSITVEVPQSEISWKEKFLHFLGCLGNYRMWVDRGGFPNFLDMMYAQAVTVKRAKVMGWNRKGKFYAFADCVVYDGEVLRVNDYGMVTVKDDTYYIPAYSKLNEDNELTYMNVRRYRHVEKRVVSVDEFFSLMIDMHGNNAIISLLFCLATDFRDIIFSHTHFFPILYLFGPKGTGKTMFASTLSKMYQYEPEIMNLASSTLAAIGNRIAMVVNMVIHLDEYKYGMQYEKIDILKGSLNSVGRSIWDERTGQRTQSRCECGLIVTGQDVPTDDPALLSRMIFLETYQSVRSTGSSKEYYTVLQEMLDAGLTGITIEMQRYRNDFAKGFKDCWLKALEEIKAKDERNEIDQRQIECWAIPYATMLCFDRLGVSFPFDKKKILDICVAGLLNQNEVSKSVSEVNTFWLLLCELQRNGMIRDKQDYMIEPVKRDIELVRNRRKQIIKKDLYPGKLLFLSYNSISGKMSLMAKKQGMENFADTTFKQYVEHSGEFLGKGTKPKFFHVFDSHGNREHVVTYNEKTKKKETMTTFNQERPLVFDYDMVKEKYGINLEKTYVTLQSDDEEGKGKDTAIEGDMFDDASSSDIQADN